MATMHRARFANGILRPLDDTDLVEGDEVMYVKTSSLPAVIAEATDKTGESIRRTAGAWVGHTDCDELIRMIYEGRELGTRPEFERPEQ